MEFPIDAAIVAPESPNDANSLAATSDTTPVHALHVSQYCLEGRRCYMEDAHFASADGHLVGVFDGHAKGC
jgi:hypothetical protein